MPGQGQGRKPDELADELERGGGVASGADEKSRRKAAQLLRNPKFRQALETLQDNPAAQEEFKRNPKGFLRGKGIQDIEDAEVTVEEQ